MTTIPKPHTPIANWKASDIPPLNGCSAIITGTGGIGFETALEIARAGAEVIIAGRNSQKGAHAVMKIRSEIPSADVRFEHLDLASLHSVADFGNRMRSQLASLNLLINNAAVMNPPTRQETTDGFELQFGTNYLAHFALTAHLMPLLGKGDGSRVITLSSIAARNGTLNLADLQSTQSYNPMAAYSQSKLACLMFALEFQRRSEAAQWGVSGIAAHPGISRTDLLHNAPGRWSSAGMMRTLLWFLFQPASQGALPSLYAATSPTAKGGHYYGPSRLAETRGAPIEVAIPSQAKDRSTASQLWQISELLAGVTFPEPSLAL